MVSPYFMNSSLEIIPSALACMALASKCMLPVARSSVTCACVPLASNSAAAARVNGYLNMASPLAWAWRCTSCRSELFRGQYAPPGPGPEPCLGHELPDRAAGCRGSGAAPGGLAPGLILEQYAGRGERLADTIRFGPVLRAARSSARGD